MKTRSKRVGKKYLQAWGSLYSTKPSTPGVGGFPKAKRASPPRIASEEAEQVRFVNWMSDEGIRHYSIPNGRSSIGENSRCNRMGQSAGCPDLCIPYGRKGFFSLYVEMKRSKGGVVSPQQKEWLQWLNANGSRAVVCYGADEAIKVVREYLK